MFFLRHSVVSRYLIIVRLPYLFVPRMSNLPPVSITRWHWSGHLPTRQLAPKPEQGSSRIMELWKWALVFWRAPTQSSVVWDSYSLRGLNIIIKYRTGFIASKLDLVSSCLNRMTVVCTWNHVPVHLSLHQHGQRLCCRQHQRQSHRCELWVAFSSCCSSRLLTTHLLPNTQCFSAHVSYIQTIYINC